MMWILQLGCYGSPGSDLLTCSLDALAAAVAGPTIFGLIAGGVLLTSFYLASNGGLATPAVLTALTGGLLISALPSAYQGIAQVIIFLGLAAAVMAGLGKYVDQTP